MTLLTPKEKQLLKELINDGPFFEEFDKSVAAHKTLTLVSYCLPSDLEKRAVMKSLMRKRVLAIFTIDTVTYVYLRITDREALVLTDMKSYLE